MLFRRFIAVIAMCVSLAGHAEAPLEQVHLLIPGGAGGGWDRTARGVGTVLSQTGLIRQVRYENMSGGGGARGIAHLLERKSPHMLMVNSSPIVIRSLQKAFPHSFRDLTPVASVIGDYSVIAVRRQSPFRNIQALATAQKQNPARVAIAGGSIAGSTDHIVAALIFTGFGASPRSVKYIPYDAGGKAMAGLLSGEVQALSSGLGEVIDMAQQGWVNILCITSAERLSLLPDTPTCLESGAQGGVFANWRGFFASPAMPPAQVEAYADTLAQMYATDAWRQVARSYGWVDLFYAQDNFAQMLHQQEADIKRLMIDLGLL
ncbi:MAG: tripartite tricarboxylate transporter substrate binding protein [bacterium]